MGDRQWELAGPSPGTVTATYYLDSDHPVTWIVTIRPGQAGGGDPEQARLCRAAEPSGQGCTGRRVRADRLPAGEPFGPK